MIKYITGLLADKPMFGVAAGFGGGLSAWLTHIQMLTPIVGFLAAVFGLTAAILTTLLKSRAVFFAFRSDWKSRKRK